MTKLRLAWFASLALASATAAAPRVADACGGCFAPPTAVQTVTYHRMALSASPSRTTLWDQFGYTGQPEEFSWILPIQGGPEVRVELADARFLAALDDASAVVVATPDRPRRNCAQCLVSSPAACRGPFAGPSAGPRAADGGVAAVDAAASGRDASVTVLNQSSVGPCAVVTLRGDDATALRAWLTTNRYVVPPALEPVLDHYVGLHMDFVALRLRDGAGVGEMQPVRITTPGYQPVLPLQMVAAGVADHVEMVLFTLADSRLEPSNFPTGALPNDQLVWDFDRDTTGIGAFRRAESAWRAARDGRGWLVESAEPHRPEDLQLIALNAASRWLGSGSGTPLDDMRVATERFPRGVVLTRLHADLPTPALDRDLILDAAPSAGTQSRSYRFDRTVNTPNPAACAPLRCASGLVIGGVGEVVDPFGHHLAPDAVLPAEYVRDSLPDYVQPYASVRYLDGRPYAGDAATATCSGLRCAAGTRPTAGASRPAVSGFAGAVLALGAVVRRARRRRRRASE